MPTKPQIFVHLVGYAGSGKTTLGHALERSHPNRILLASRIERGSNIKRLRVQIRVLRYVPRIMGFALMCRPLTLRAYFKIFNTFLDYYLQRTRSAEVPVPIVVFDEGIPHRLRVLRRMLGGRFSFNDLPRRSQVALAREIDCIIIVKPPADIVQERLTMRGSPPRYSSKTFDAHYEESIKKTLGDVRALESVNPGVFSILTAPTADIDEEAQRIAEQLLVASVASSAKRT
ncbi:hypothetical protein [uncultured Marivita sp.]|uniref:hypothetical protein n=1 Tax=uncultured Marivita sp. TaxID=888080 RepID=UPI0026233221|nr:hypothetical protein [uncultured Marivita sp.]